MVDDLKKGYYLLFIDGGKRANEQGQAEGAIGVILQEPDCGEVLPGWPKTLSKLWFSW